MLPPETESESRLDTVVVFRRDLFLPSEVFITQQASAFRARRVIYVGEAVHGPPPRDSTYLLLRNRQAVRQLLAAMVSERSVIHAHFALDGLRAIGLANRSNSPLYVTLHGFDVTRSRRSMLLSMRPNLMALALRRRALLNSATRFLAVSQYIEDVAIQGGYPADKVSVHHVGIRLDAQPMTVAPAEPGRRPRVITVGRLVEKKGTIHLLHAIRILMSRGMTPSLIVVGSGPLEAQLCHEGQDLIEQGIVQLHGTMPHPDVMSAIRKSDVFVLPSITASNGDSEGLGQVLLEAALLATPIVASRSGGIVDFVRHEETGLLTEPASPVSLADAIQRLVTDADLVQRVTASASARVATLFDVDCNTRQLERQMLKDAEAMLDTRTQG